MMGSWVFAGVANGVTNVARQALTRLRTPEHLRGRVFAAADSAMRTSSVLGTLVAGVAAAIAGLGMLFATRERQPAQVA